MSVLFMQKKILFLTPWFPSHREDQTGNYILDSLEALANLGHELTVLVTQPWRPKLAKILSKDWNKPPIDVTQFSEKFNLKVHHHFSIPRHYFRPISNYAYKYQIGSKLEALARKNHCELIHAHTELAGWLAVNVAKRLCIPSVVTLHGIDTDKKLYCGITKKQLYEYTISNADRLVLVGEPLINFFKNFTQKSDHFRVVHNGFRLTSQMMSSDKKMSERHFRFVSVSNLHEGKGIDINLYALAKLKAAGIKNWTYKIIGDGYERKNLETLVNTLRLRDCVFFIGGCQHKDVYTHLSESDIFILPSYREAFGIAYVEAMSFGLLTIGVKGQGPSAFIKHGKTGLLISPNSVYELASTLQAAFQSPHEMLKIANAGKQYIINHFTWRDHALNLTKIYDELLTRS